MPARARPFDGADDPRSWTAYGAGLNLRRGQLVLDSLAHARQVVPSSQVLDEFIGLAIQPPNPVVGDIEVLAGVNDDAVLAFARRNGWLDLCGHCLRRGHQVAFTPAALIGDMHVEIPWQCPRAIGEPVWVWGYWVRQARALRRVIARLRAWKQADPADLTALGEWGPWARELLAFDGASGWRWQDDLRPGLPSGSLDRQKVYATEALDRWLALAQVGVRLGWRKERARLELGGGGLLGGLGLQLLHEAAGVEAILPCDWCQEPHVPVQSGARGTRTFCASCRGRHVPAILASREFRQRKQETDPGWAAHERDRVSRSRQRPRSSATAEG